MDFRGQSYRLSCQQRAVVTINAAVPLVIAPTTVRPLPVLTMVHASYFICRSGDCENRCQKSRRSRYIIKHLINRACQVQCVNFYYIYTKAGVVLHDHFCFFLCQIFNCQCTIVTIFLSISYICRQTVLLTVAEWFSNLVLVSSIFHLILLILGTLLYIRSFRLEMLLFHELLFLMPN